MNRLSKACSDGNIDLVKRLIEKGADIHFNYDEPLMEASINGYLEVVKYLVEKGADIHAENDDALMLASEYGNLETVKYLVEQGADIHAINGMVLIMAGLNSDDNRSIIFKYLIQQGVNIPEKMNVPEDVQEIVIQNDVSNIRNIKNLTPDLKKKYDHLLMADSFGMFEDEHVD